MFPNPQDALPLPPRPSLERYRKIAKGLVKACKEAGDLPSASDGLEESPAAHDDWAEAWAGDWIDDLIRLSGVSFEPEMPVRVDRWIGQVADFARRQLKGSAAHGRVCALSDAQFVIARSHGFESWPKFVRALEALEHSGSSESKFEAAADAIVSGDAATLKRLLTEEPDLIRARSKREHGASLLHYVAANGVEGYRQKTPKSIVDIAELLLNAGADVNATANVYGGGCTTLGLVATSLHPERAGVQEELMRLLLEHGARIDDGLVRSCLANGRGKAAEFLAGRVAHLDLDEAAGVGRPDLVASFFAQDGSLRPGVPLEQFYEGFLSACSYGRNDVIEFLIGTGVDLAGAGNGGRIALREAVIGGHLETVKLLLRHREALEARKRSGNPVLEQALWSAAHGGDTEVYIAVLEALTAAGVKLPERHVPVNPRVDEWLEKRGSHAEPRWYWYGERPRSEKR